jgi:hypothetical protein
MLMLRVFSLAMMILVLGSGTARAAAGLDSDENAALTYWQAFATLPRFTPPENQKLGECLTTPLDETARKMLTDAEYALKMLHRGVARRGCDWGMSYEEGILTRLPHADAARVLTALACLRGRLRFEAGQSAEAIDDLLAAMNLARHVSWDQSLTTGLVGYNIEHRAIETLAASLPKLNPTTLNDLKTRLDALPPFGSQGRALLTSEKESLEWFIRKVKEAKDKESLLASLSWVGISERENIGSSTNAASFLKACGGTAEGVIKLADELLPCHPAMAKMLDLPLEQFETQFHQESIKRAGNPLYKVFFSALAKVRQARARADVRRALLSAAIAVQVDGQDKLKSQLDPSVGRPFERIPFEGGFELRSKLIEPSGKPVMLTVGRRG